MLRSLHIVNFAIIEDSIIELTEGANVFTGETGAGKSILVDALAMLTGKRAKSELIRTGADFFKVEGLFDCDEEVSKWLQSMGFDASTDEVIVSRKLSRSGHGTCMVNGDFCTVKQLQSLGSLLLHLHEQHDTMELLSPSYCEKIIDTSSEEAKTLYADYGKAYAEWKENYEALCDFESKRQENERRLDILAWEIEEIRGAEIIDGEEEEVEKRLSVLENHEKIIRALESALAVLTSDGGVQDQLGQVEKEISTAASYDETLASAEESIRTSVFGLEDAISLMDSYVADADFSEEELQELQNRSEVLMGLKRKFGPTLTDVIKYLARAEEEHDKLAHMIYETGEMKEKVAVLYETVSEKAEALNRKRLLWAKPLITSVLSIIHDLGMEKARMELKIVPSKEPHPLGAESLEFYFSANPGEPLRPMRDTASGGELSRISLATEILISDLLAHKTMVFDEIDVGISGKVGLQVARKLKELAKAVQVLIITHLPQTASIAQRHYHIEKVVENDKTTSRAVLLEEDEQIQQVAQMISGTTDSPHALQSAKDMKKILVET